MLRKISVSVCLLCTALLFVVAPVFAQDDPTVIANGLNNPRGIAFDPAGDLWIVEAGNAGDLRAEGPFGETDGGGSGALARVSPDGALSRVVMTLPSMDFGNSRGAQAVLVTEESIWLLIGETQLAFPLSHSLIELDRTNYRIKTHIDLYTLEAEQNPDGDIISSNPTDFAVGVDGDPNKIVIANAGCNCLESWTPDGGVELYTSWSIDDNPVPTTVAVDAAGMVYVGFLTGFPFPTGSSRIEVYSNGELVKTYSGLTAVVDVLVSGDGTIYATEHGVWGDTGWNLGRVVMVNDEGVTPIIESLERPWGLAQDAEGNLYVSVGSAETNGNGSVIQIPMP